jgi:hypothetical protein
MALAERRALEFTGADFRHVMSQNRADGFRKVNNLAMNTVTGRGVTHIILP